MAARDIELMERHRLMEAQPRPELDDDQILEAVETLMRLNPRFKAAMAEVLRDTLIAKGENVAINLGITFPPED
jgi:chromosome segregation ATPase